MRGYRPKPLLYPISEFSTLTTPEAGGGREEFSGNKSPFTRLTRYTQLPPSLRVRVVLSFMLAPCAEVSLGGRTGTHS